LKQRKEPKKIQERNDNSPFLSSFLDFAFVLLWLQHLFFMLEPYDWNCPQHITPRYTLEDMEDIYSQQLNYISKLEEEIKTLRSQPKIK
jgi:hypothetical protein